MSNNVDPRTQPDFWIGHALDLVLRQEPEKYVAALTCAEKAVNMAPHRPDALLLLGSILLQMGKSDEAEVWLNKADELARDFKLVPSEPSGVILRLPPPDRRKAKLNEEISRLTRDGYSYREIIEVAEERERYWAKQQKQENYLGLREMAKLLSGNKDLGHYEAARKVSEEPPDNAPRARRLVRRFKEAAAKYLADRWHIEDALMGRSPSPAKSLTDEDRLNWELMYLDLCYPGILDEIVGNRPI